MIRNFFNTLWDRWANLHPFLRFLIYATLLGVGGLVGLKPLYKNFKAWRVDRNLSAAKTAVESVKMDEARDLSLTVLQSGDPRIEAFRILEKSMDSLRDPRHGDIARALISHPGGSDADRLVGFRGMAVEAPLGLLGQAWAALPVDCRAKSEFALIFGHHLMSANRLSEVASVLLGVPEDKRTAEVNQLLVQVLIRSGKSDGLDEAQRWIASKWPVNGDVNADGWFDVLEEIPVLSLRADLLKPVTSILTQGNGVDPVRAALALARFEYVGNFSGRAGFLEKTVERWKSEAPASLAKFLSDLGLHRMLLDTFPPGKDPLDEKLFPLVLGSLVTTGDWEKVLPLLDGNEDKLSKHDWLAYRAIAESKTGDTAGMVRDWNAAINEARSDSPSSSFLRLYQLAISVRMDAEASQAMLEAIRVGRGHLPLYEDLKPLLRFLAAQGRENELMQICAIYVAFEPGNPVLLTQYAYLACLNALADPALIIKALKPMADAFPDAMPIQCVMATAYLANYQPAMAAETLDRLKLVPENLSPGYRAAFYTTQILNKRMKKNDPAITNLPWKVLLPSERRKFNEWIRAAEE